VREEPDFSGWGCILLYSICRKVFTRAGPCAGLSAAGNYLALRLTRLLKNGRLRILQYTRA
jgi:hypothetical protein